MPRDNDELPLYPPPREPSRPLDPPPSVLQWLYRDGLLRARNYDGTVVWVVTRYEDVKRISSDVSVSSDPRKPGFPEKNAGFKATVGQDRNLRTMDPPEHTQHKRMVVRDFTVRRLEEMKPKIQAKIDSLIEAMLARGSPGDLVADLGFPLPTQVICEVLGVPYEDRDFFGERAQKCFTNEVTPADAAAAGQELFAYTDRLLDRKDAAPENDLLSRLVVEQLRPGNVSRADIIGVARLLLIAGHETVANTISVSTLALLQNPAQYADLRAHPDILENAIDELLRYTSTPHLGRRRAATVDLEVNGQLIKAGDGVIIANNVADRDERVFERPHELDLRRANARANLTFGYGPHQCLGQLLARVELQLVHKALMSHMPALRLDCDPAALEFVASGAVYGLRSLPVAW